MGAGWIEVKKTQNKGMFHQSRKGEERKAKSERGRPTTCRSPQEMSGGVNHMVLVDVEIDLHVPTFLAFHTQGKYCASTMFLAHTLEGRAGDSECRSFLFLSKSFRPTPTPPEPDRSHESPRAETDPKHRKGAPPQIYRIGH